jgi:hypothetical protein
MTRIFPVLALGSAIVLIGAMMLGLSIGNLYELPQPAEATLHQATLHRLSGIAAALAVVFVESIVVTYFIGTSRWCKEVVDTYQLDREPVIESTRLKRRTFPWALAGMLTAVGIISLGGAADPATLRQGTQAWAQWHLIGAILGITFIGWTYLVAWNNIVANQGIIERVVADVSRYRQERGADADNLQTKA